MRRILSAAALVLLAACSSATAPTGDVRVATDKRTYGIFEPTVTVPFTVSNATLRPVSLARCGASPVAALQRLDAGEWVDITSGFCLANLDQTPIVLQPGGTAAGVVQVERMVGTFRIVLPAIGSDKPRGISPTFVVRWLED